MASASSTSPRPSAPATKPSNKRKLSSSAEPAPRAEKPAKNEDGAVRADITAARAASPSLPAASPHLPTASPRLPAAAALPVPSVAAAAASSSTSPSIHARATRPLTFAHKAFSDKNMKSGKTGEQPRYHAFTQSSFPQSGTARSATEAAKTYIQETGLTKLKTDVRPDWGVTSGPARAGASRMYQSRRGSIVGLSDMPDGSIKGWRLHSLPTSEALRDQSTSKTFAEKFEARAALLSKPAVNTVGTEQSVNAVLSDVGKVRFDNTKGAFSWTEGSYAMGVSAKGLDKKNSSPSADVYGPSRDAAEVRDKNSMPAQTDHSEPMAVKFHNQVRGVSMKDDTGLVGVFASFPNQVCAHCGEMFQDNIGKNSVVAGTPGRKFGGQKPGEISTRAGSAVIRAHPMKELTADTTHRAEVSNIAKYHSL